MKKEGLTMKKLNVLLVCGSGASSGFMAANIRKSAKKKNIEMKVTARSEAEIENYIDDIDILMIGPHLTYLADDLEERLKDSKIKVLLMKPEYYATLNGDMALEHMLTVVEK